MPPLPKSNGVTRTRLHPKDRTRLREIAKQRGLTEAEIARFALLEFLAAERSEDLKKHEAACIESLKATNDALVSLLLRMAADLRAVYMFVGEEDADSINGLRQEAWQMILRALPSMMGRDQIPAKLLKQVDDANNTKT